MNEQKQSLSTQPYRGTRDFFPEDMRKLDYIFSVWRKVAENFGYEQYLGPLLEPWELYATKNVSGEEIVNEQLYWFEDKSERKLAIRPEMTPTVARMIAARAKQLPKPIRWYSIANFMRYEKPQKGRVREFFQLNLDIFGDRSMQADAEVIETAIAIMREFGADENMFEIRVNNRKLIDFWIEDSLKFKGERPKLIRIIDQSAKQTREQTQKQLEKLQLSTSQINEVFDLLSNDLTWVDSIKNQDPEGTQGASELIELFDLLAERDLTRFVKFEASLMRGFDYYTGNVFEQFDLNPNNKRSMFGGGRYDDLVNLFGVEPITAVGYAPGDVTTLNFLGNWQLLPEFGAVADVLVTVFNEDLRINSWQAANELRKANIKTELYLKTGDGVTTQLKYANRIKIPNVIIIGPGEVDSETVVWKDMEKGEQSVLPLSEVIKKLS